MDAMAQALLNAKVPLPDLLELEIERDPKKGKEKKGENLSKRQVQNPAPILVLGGNDRPRPNDDLQPELSLQPSKIGDEQA